jgi:hypothetical protein
VQGLLEIFGHFLLVLFGVELLETLKAFVKARKVMMEEPMLRQA